MTEIHFEYQAKWISMQYCEKLMGGGISWNFYKASTVCNGWQEKWVLVYIQKHTQEWSVKFLFWKTNQITTTHQSMLRIWLWSARNETGDSMASRDLAQRRTTLSPVRWIFSVSWSTAILEGAQTRTEPPLCFTKWYTMVADVTVLPVPGGPWISESGRWTACFTAYTYTISKHPMNPKYQN